MSGVTKNAALNVKIHGKLKNRLTADMYIRMTNLKSVPQVAGFLKNETSYRDLLLETDTENIHRGYLERILWRSIHQDIKGLTAFTDISQTAFMKLFSIQEEIENLKLFLRHFCAGHPERFNAISLSSVKGGIDFARLAGVKNFDEFMDIIKDTIYAVPLRSFSGYRSQQNIFDFEEALDSYFTELKFKMAKKSLDAKEYEIVKETCGTEEDLKFIMLLIRAKRNFDFPKERLYPYLSRRYAHLSDEIARRMINAATAEEIYEIVKETRYKNVLESRTASPERQIEKYLQSVHARMFRKSGYSIEAALYYIKVRETEIRNIITIIEGIRYGLAPVMIQRYIMTVGENL